ncbi:MAG: MOSC domain-containing protein [Planctomycetota bacterium]
MPMSDIALSAKLLAVSVGGVREIEHNGRSVPTGIYKSPVIGPVKACGVSLVGDEQADLTVHGGPGKAVYGFASEHYPAWREAFPDVEFTWGAFGENLTTGGIVEDDLMIGDRFRVGTAELTITQPRQPCFKFAIRLGDKRVGKHMIATGQSGFYFTISREGELQQGDRMELIDRLDHALPLAEMNRLFYDKRAAAAELRRVADAPGMLDEWREWFTREADKREAG